MSGIRSILLCFVSSLILSVVIDFAKCLATTQQSGVAKGPIKTSGRDQMQALNQILLRKRDVIRSTSEIFNKVNKPELDLSQQGRKRLSAASVDGQFNETIFNNQIETWAKKSRHQDLGHFVKDLAEQASVLAPTGYSVMVLDTNQTYERESFETIASTSVRWKETSLGVWIFRCGCFESEENWHLKQWVPVGPNYDISSDKKIIFYSPDCFLPEYRYKKILSDSKGHAPPKLPGENDGTDDANIGRSPDIFIAAWIGNLDDVKYFIQKKNIPINSVDDEGWTSFHLASMGGHLEIGKFLVGKGADVNALAEKGLSPLSIASLNGRIDFAQYLVDEKKADVNVIDNEHETPLHKASKANHADVVRLLLERGAKPDVKDKDGNTPLDEAKQAGNTDIVELLKSHLKISLRRSSDVFEAVKTGNLDDVKYFIQKKNIPINSVDNEGWTSFHLASMGGHLEIGKFLVGKGADVNARSSQGWTPLGIASFNNRIDFVRYLVDEKKADVNCIDKEGETPLHKASKKNLIDVVRFLLEKGAKYDVKNSKGDTPLDLANKARNTAVADLLESHAGNQRQSLDIFEGARMGNLRDVRNFIDIKGISVHSVNKKGLTPLHLASQEGHLEVARFLVNNGADVNARSSKGVSPLSIASLNGRIDCVRYLVDERKADVNVIDNEHETPLHKASKKNHIDIVRFLLEKGAKYDVKNSRGELPLDLANKARNTAVADLLRSLNDSQIKRSADIFEAAMIGNLDEVKYFIEMKGISVHSVYRKGLTPLHLASMGGHLGVAKFLIDSGADLNALAERDLSPLSLATVFGRFDIVRYLVDEKKADVNCIDKEGETPLHLASKGNHTNMIRFLLGQSAKYASKDSAKEIANFLINKSANLDAQTRSGRTPLSYSAASDYSGIFESLMKNGANVNIKDNNRRNPLHWAAVKGSINVLSLLRNHHVLFDEKDKDGNTPLALAQKAGHQDFLTQARQYYKL